MAMFNVFQRLTGHSGFQMKFENGYEISIVWGGGMSYGNGEKVAEIAARQNPQNQ